MKKHDLTRDLKPAERHKVNRRQLQRLDDERHRGTHFPEPGDPSVQLTEPVNFVHPSKRGKNK
jgi:hypothetical protein